jgi:hypothetical protein
MDEPGHMVVVNHHIMIFPAADTTIAALARDLPIGQIWELNRGCLLKRRGLTASMHEGCQLERAEVARVRASTG